VQLSWELRAGGLRCDVLEDGASDADGTGLDVAGQVARSLTRSVVSRALSNALLEGAEAPPPAPSHALRQGAEGGLPLATETIAPPAVAEDSAAGRFAIVRQCVSGLLAEVLGRYPANPAQPPASAAPLGDDETTISLRVKLDLVDGVFQVRLEEDAGGDDTVAVDDGEDDAADIEYTVRILPIDDDERGSVKVQIMETQTVAAAAVV